MKPIELIISSVLIFTSFICAADRPNILWIISEDNSTTLGCYGDKNAKTPNLDQLASKGIRFTNCFANAPVCAAARSTLFLGMHATSAGTYHMRSLYRVPEQIRPYFSYLREAGYFATNGKSDINTSTHSIKSIVNGASKQHIYLNRADKTAPFIAVHNLLQSHESRIFSAYSQKGSKQNEGFNLEHPMDLPPYQADTNETSQDWGRVYKQINRMDQAVGVILKALGKSGEADNTIILYCSDHAGIMIRSKRYLFDSGTRVPMIAYFPEKWKHLAPTGYQPGGVCERLTDFTDVSKTLLSIAGVEAPSHFSGKAFAGNVEPAKDKVLLFSGRFDECPDNSRALTDGRYRYLRNYESDRNLNQLESYTLRQASQKAQYYAFKSGSTNEYQNAIYDYQPAEAFFDTANDPHEVTNLIHSEEHQKLIALFRKELDQQLISTHDLGFIPEPLIAEIDETQPVYEWAQSAENYPLQELLLLANLIGQTDPASLERFKSAIQSSNRIKRYWGVLGLRVAGTKAGDYKPLLFNLLKDEDSSVRITAACTLGKLGIDQTDFLLNEAKRATTDAHATWALDVLKLLEVTNIPSDLAPADYTKGQYSLSAFNDIQKCKSYTKLPD